MRGGLFLSVIVFFLMGCASPQAIQVSTEQNPLSQEQIAFTNDEFSFAFEYPSNWVERSQELPNNWAILDEEKNTILFTVNEAKYDSVALLGRVQALRDYHPGKEGDALTQEDLDVVNNVVKIQEFKGVPWYTYAIDFSQKGVTSIVSGVICGDNEVTIVLVTAKEFFERNQEVYVGMLNSFSCSA